MRTFIGKFGSKLPGSVRVQAVLIDHDVLMIHLRPAITDDNIGESFFSDFPEILCLVTTPKATTYEFDCSDYIKDFKLGEIGDASETQTLCAYVACSAKKMILYYTGIIKGRRLDKLEG